MLLLIICLVLAAKSVHKVTEPIAKARFKPDYKLKDIHKIWSKPAGGPGTNRSLRAEITWLNREIKRLESDLGDTKRKLHRTQAHLDELRSAIQDITGSVHFINCNHPHCDYYATEIGKMQTQVDALAGAASAAS